MAGSYEKLYEKLSSFDLIIFDMDGTLYFQKSLQIKMACRLIKHAFFEKRGMKDLKAVLCYRRIRERWDAENDIDEEAIFEEVSGKCGLQSGEVKAVVERWMFKEPLKAVAESKDRRLIRVMERLVSGGKNVCIYSDYPAREKAESLGVPEKVRLFSSGSDGIDTMKPNPAGILHVMSQYPGTGKAEVIMVGDRDDRDGEAARRAGVDHIILRRFQAERVLTL